MVMETDVRFHGVDDVRDRRDVRRLIESLREPGAHVLVLDSGTELPQGAGIEIASVIRAAAVVTCAVSRVEGEALAAFAAGSLRVGLKGTEFSWGMEPIVPGLSAVLSAACPRAFLRLMWGEVMNVEETDGLVHRVVDDVASLGDELPPILRTIGGVEVLSLRLRSAAAAQELASWSSAAAFDRHLREAAVGS